MPLLTNRSLTSWTGSYSPVYVVPWEKYQSPSMSTRSRSLNAPGFGVHTRITRSGTRLGGRIGLLLTQNGTNTDRVLVDQVHRLLGINDIALWRAVDELLLNLKISRRLLPAYLNG
jgi:hypothetical protein